MARQRNFAREYQRRLSLGLERGETRQQARGKRAGPEHPVRALSNPERYWDYIQRDIPRIHALARSKAGQRRVAKLNQARMEEGLSPIHFEEPPAMQSGMSARTFDSLEEAEGFVQGIPDPYRGLYVHSGGVTAVRIRGEGRRSRRAA